LSQFLQVESQDVAIQLKQLEELHKLAEREFSASRAEFKIQLESMQQQLQKAEDAALSANQVSAADQDELRQARALLAAESTRVQSLTLKVSNLEMQLQHSQQNLDAAREKLLAVEHQLRDTQDQSRAASQASSRAIETQSAAHLLAQAQHRDALVEANARAGQLAAQLSACEHRLQAAASRAAAAEQRLVEITNETTRQLESQEETFESVAAANKRQSDAALAQAEHRCQLMKRALEEAEAYARAMDSRAIQAETDCASAIEAKIAQERGLMTAAETWQDRQ
jgi:chromosome segregation ATPase